MKVKVLKYTAIAAWHWKGVKKDDACGICRAGMEETCPSCRIPGPQCPLTFGACGHAFHEHCIDQWLIQNSTCPMDRTNWQAKPSRRELKEQEARNQRDASFVASVGAGPGSAQTAPQPVDEGLPDRDSTRTMSPETDRHSLATT